MTWSRPTLHYTPALILLCCWNTPTYSPTSGPPCLLFLIPGMLFSGLFARHPPSHPLGFSLNAISSGKPSPKTTSNMIRSPHPPSTCPFPSAHSPQPRFFGVFLCFGVHCLRSWSSSWSVHDKCLIHIR